jgi:hypothetical protein
MGYLAVSGLGSGRSWVWVVGLGQVEEETEGGQDALGMLGVRQTVRLYR